MPKVYTTISRGMKTLLDQCVGRDLYGNESQTLRYFINVGLDRLVTQGRLTDVPVPLTGEADDEDPEPESQP